MVLEKKVTITTKKLKLAFCIEKTRVPKIKLFLKRLYFYNTVCKYVIFSVLEDAKLSYLHLPKKKRIDPIDVC